MRKSSSTFGVQGWRLMAIREFLLGSVSAVALLAAGEAHAQSNTIVLGASSYSAVHIDDLWFNVATCTYSGSGMSATSCSTGLPTAQSTDELVFSISGNSVAVSLINPASSGAPVLTSAASGTGTYVDLSIGLRVWSDGSSSRTSISSVSNAMTGTATGSGRTSNITASLSMPNGSTGILLNAGGPTSGTVSFAPIHPVAYPNSGASLFAYDLKISNPVGNTLSLTNVTTHYGPAPEPASLALFGTGTAALTVFRRSRRRLDNTRD
jgi:hypothetical protein